MDSMISLRYAEAAGFFVSLATAPGSMLLSRCRGKPDRFKEISTLEARSITLLEASILAIMVQVVYASSRS